MRTDLVVLFKDVAGEWRWRFVASNGHIMATGAEGYRRRIDCLNGAKRVTGRRLARRLKFVTGPGGPS